MPLCLSAHHTGAGNLLVPQEPFELLVRRSIAALLPPALTCKELVYEELLNIAEQTCPKEAARCAAPSPPPSLPFHTFAECLAALRALPRPRCVHVGRGKR